MVYVEEVKTAWGAVVAATQIEGAVVAVTQSKEPDESMVVDEISGEQHRYLVNMETDVGRLLFNLQEV